MLHCRRGAHALDRSPKGASGCLLLPSSSRRARAKRVNAVHELCNFRQHFHLKSVQVRIHDAVPCVKTHGCVQVPLLGRTRSQGVQASLPYLAHIISYNSIHTRSISLHWECLRLHGRRHCSPGARWACGAKLVAHRVQPTTDWPTHPTPAQFCLKTLVTQCTDHQCSVGSAGVMLCLKYKSCWSQRAADASSAWSVRPRYPCIANQGLTRPCPPPHTHSTPLMHTNGSYSSSSSSAAAAAAAGFFLPGPLNVAAFSSGSSPTL